MKYGGVIKSLFFKDTAVPIKMQEVLFHFGYSLLRFLFNAVKNIPTFLFEEIKLKKQKLL